MPSPTTIPLSPSHTYHIYGRATGSELLFREEDNHHFFLHLYKKYITPLADTYSYCLMPNHYHFLMRLKNEEEVGKYRKCATELSSHPEIEKYISQQFSNFLNSYAKAYNKRYNRMGGLFIRPFKRKLVVDEKYRTKLVHYIHHNPLSAGLVKNIEDYKFSSYASFINGNKEWLQVDEVLNWFDNKSNFIYCHQQPVNVSGMTVF